MVKKIGLFKEFFYPRTFEVFDIVNFVFLSTLKPPKRIFSLKKRNVPQCLSYRGPSGPPPINRVKTEKAKQKQSKMAMDSHGGPFKPFYSIFLLFSLFFLYLAHCLFCLQGFVIRSPFFADFLSEEERDLLNIVQLLKTETA